MFIPLTSLHFLETASPEIIGPVLRNYFGRASCLLTPVDIVENPFFGTCFGFCDHPLLISSFPSRLLLVDPSGTDSPSVHHTVLQKSTLNIFLL